MREIKFRVFKDGIMTPLTRRSLSVVSGRICCEAYNDAGGVAELPIMQFTGRKDKDDVDIYDGDIVKVTEYIGGNYIDYCRTNKRVSLNRFGWCLQPVDRDISSPSGLYLSDGESWTVIGNIHQNPELLES